MPGTDRDPSPPDAETAASGHELPHDDPDPGDAAPEPPMPPFEPLFTLLTNSTTNTTVHPRIHYLFSDDDPSALASPAAGADERALVVDLAPAPEGDPGRWAVSWAASLTPEFAVTRSSVAVQQSEGDDDGRSSGALMLRVEGVEREPVEMRPDSLPSSGSGAIGGEDTDGLAEDFRRRMGVLKKVVDEGERRRAVVGEQQQQEKEADVDEDEGGPEEAVVDSDEGRGVDKGKKKATAEED
ncbi:hypothetical protein FZEAL_5115 [Fusarium zealandicum]|uniref:Uncharacterized protein n=1 Tax=Fusarium zealandicum TaxID=1053134 RepID=A0A8H4UKD5_9HYPO|nr:hypothetical protein FZEAL_5115 [Fusarium zealandicum]